MNDLYEYKANKYKYKYLELKNRIEYIGEGGLWGMKIPISRNYKFWNKTYYEKKEREQREKEREQREKEREQREQRVKEQREQREQREKEREKQIILYKCPIDNNINIEQYVKGLNKKKNDRIINDGRARMQGGRENGEYTIDNYIMDGCPTYDSMINEKKLLEVYYNQNKEKFDEENAVTKAEYEQRLREELDAKIEADHKAYLERTKGMTPEKIQADLNNPRFRDY